MKKSNNSWIFFSVSFILSKEIGGRDDEYEQ